MTEHVRDNDNECMTETMKQVSEVVLAIPNIQLESISEETCSLIEVQFNIANIQYKVKVLKRCIDSPELVAETVRQLIELTTKP